MYSEYDGQAEAMFIGYLTQCGKVYIFSAENETHAYNILCSYYAGCECYSLDTADCHLEVYRVWEDDLINDGLVFHGERGLYELTLKVTKIGE